MNRVGIGIDVHRFAPNRKCIIGGVQIPHPVGLLGHSDADVLAHAIADALLGAVALGEVTRDAGRVLLQTAIGGTRLIDVPQGELLPRIC